MGPAAFVRRRTQWLLPNRLQVRLREIVPRLTTSASRVDPSFIVIGTQRAGTTSLFQALGEHPQVIPPPLKELHHFDHDRPWPHFAYRCYFPTQREIDERAEEVGAPVFTGEATPNYLFHPDVPARVAAALPDARFVVVLREPVARAWSHLRMLNSRDWSAETSLRAAIESAPPVPARRRPRHHWTRPYGRERIFERGLYAEQLERWFGSFPRERFVIVRFEDLFGPDGSAVYDDVCRFLGLAPGLWPSSTHLNRGEELALPPEEAAWLADLYAEPNRALEELVGISWGPDREAGAPTDARQL